MILIGIAGKKKSGKTTSAEILKELLPNSMVINFADSLKEEVAKALGTTVEYIERNKDNFRLILQGYGTDYRRKLFSDNYWIERLAAKIAQLPSTIQYVIIADVRFKNEAEMIRRYNGKLIRIIRSCKEYDKDGHSSETELGDYIFDYYITNNLGIEHLKDQLRSFLFTFNL